MPNKSHMEALLSFAMPGIFWSAGLLVTYALDI